MSDPPSDRPVERAPNRLKALFPDLDDGLYALARSKHNFRLVRLHDAGDTRLSPKAKKRVKELRSRRGEGRLLTEDPFPSSNKNRFLFVRPENLWYITDEPTPPLTLDTKGLAFWPLSNGFTSEAYPGRIIGLDDLTASVNFGEETAQVPRAAFVPLILAPLAWQSLVFSAIPGTPPVQHVPTAEEAPSTERPSHSRLLRTPLTRDQMLDSLSDQLGISLYFLTLDATNEECTRVRRLLRDLKQEGVIEKRGNEYFLTRPRHLIPVQPNIEAFFPDI